VWVHSDSKNGKDAGVLAGSTRIGVRATQDAVEILGGDADCIVYAAPAPQRMKEAIGEMCRILAAGQNNRDDLDLGTCVPARLDAA